MKRGFAAQFGERLNFISPQPRRRDLRFTSTSYGVFRNFYHSPPAVVSHFRFKKDLILYLNSSRAASSGEFKFKMNKELLFSCFFWKCEYQQYIARISSLKSLQILQPLLKNLKVQILDRYLKFEDIIFYNSSVYRYNLINVYLCGFLKWTKNQNMRNWRVGLRN
jgi:hypothetical protein